MFAFLMCLLVQASFGQRISRSYSNRSMSEVLKDLDKATRRFKIVLSIMNWKISPSLPLSVISICRKLWGGSLDFIR